MHRWKTRLGAVRTASVVVLAVVVVLAPLVLLATLSVQAGTASMRREVDSRLSSSANLGARFVEARMQGVLNVAQALSASPALHAALLDPVPSPADTATIREHLVALHDAVSGSDAAFIANPAGTVEDVQPAEANVVGGDFSQRDWYRGVSTRQATYLSEAYVSSFVGHPLTVAAASPLFAVGNHGRLLGILVVAYPLTAIQAFADQYGSASHLTLSVIDQHGHLVAGPGSADGQLQTVVGEPGVDAALAGHSGLVDIQSDGGRGLFAYAPIPAMSWAVVAETDAVVALREATQLQNKVLLLSLILALILIAGLTALGINLAQRRKAQHALAALNLELEARVADRTAELKTSNQELEAFTYSVSHDLRAPIRVISGFSSKLQARASSGADPELVRYAERIAANAGRMGELVDELLALSRISRQELDRRTFLPAEVVKRALEVLHDEVLATRAQVDVDEMAACEGDPGLVEQVYANLLSNALKYSRKKASPRVEVGSTDDPEIGTVYYVRDNGAGFDMRFKDKLFGVFQRLHGADEYDGNGVGLAIVQRIVSRHGGKVFAEGTVGIGATFSFTLGRTA